MDIAIMAPRRSDQQRRSARGGVGRQIPHRLLTDIEKGRLQHQILGRIAGDEQLRTHQQIGALRTRRGEGRAQLADIAGHVADRRIELRQGDDKAIRAGHHLQSC
jgi:hypothetical protein